MTPDLPASYQSGFSSHGYGYASGHGGHARDSSDLSFDAEIDETVDEKTLSKYLDGMHCFDQICTELELSERELTARLKRHPWEVIIIHR